MISLVDKSTGEFVMEDLSIKDLLLIKKVYSKQISANGYESSFAIFASALMQQEFKSQQQLSDFVGCNKAHTSRTLLKMQLKGLIKPVSKNISLTQKGKEFAQEVQNHVCHLKSNLLLDVTEKDLAVFEKVLKKIITNANNMEGNK